MKLSQLPLLIGSNFPVVALESPLPERMAILEHILRTCGLPNNLPCLVWNVGQAVLKEVRLTENGTGIKLHSFDAFKPQMDSRIDVLNFMMGYTTSVVFILENLHPWLAGSGTAWQIVSQVTNVFYDFLNDKERTKRLILLGQDIQLHSSLIGIIPLVENSLPDAEAIAATVDIYTKALKTSIESNSAGKHNLIINLSAQEQENLTRAASGLTLEEIRAGLRLIAREHWRFDGTTPALMGQYKAEKLKHFNLEFISHPDIPTFGGLDLLRQEMICTQKLFSPEARKYNLPIPKGVLLAGPPGTGKTLTAKVIAQMWNMPMVPVDWGSLYGGVVGESEQNLRRILAIAEACAPCLLYLDDLDKGLGGHDTNNDGGISRRMAGKFLTWMQEKSSAVYVVATVNRIDALPAELTRVGRFDAIYFIDLPNSLERQQIFELHLKKYDNELVGENRLITMQDLRLLAAETQDCSGAEIAGLVDTAARDAFYEDRPNKITVADLLRCRRSFKPLAEREAARIEAMRDWASRSAKPASSPEQQRPADGHLSPNLLLD